MTSSQPTPLPHAFFLPTDTGKRFCLFHVAQQTKAQGCVLYLHPFAEELNSTRRIAAQQSRALAQAGYNVLQMDLLGCGDSQGDFAEANWSAWLQDAHCALQWLQAHASGPLWLWGMRCGALLATELASTLTETVHLLLWQPVLNGQQQLQQFLRLHTASQWLENGNAKKQSPAYQLAQGQAVHIAGYTVSPALAEGLAAAKLQPPIRPAAGRLVWLELSARTAAELGPASAAHLNAWHMAGWQTEARMLSGPAFWQVVGTDEAPELLQATLQALSPASALACAP